MSQLLPCSHCQRTFTLRDDVSENALLRCPNCSSQIRVSELQDTIYAPWHVVHDPAHASPSPASLVPPSADETVHDTIVDPSARLGLLGGLPIGDLPVGMAAGSAPTPSPSNQPAFASSHHQPVSNADKRVDPSELTVVEAYDETSVIDPASLNMDELMKPRPDEEQNAGDDIFKTIPQSFKMSQDPSWQESPENEPIELADSVDDETGGTVEDFDKPDLLDAVTVDDKEPEYDQTDEVELIDEVQVIDHSDEHNQGAEEQLEELSLSDVLPDEGVQDTLTADDMQLSDLTKEMDVSAIAEEEDNEFDTQNDFALSRESDGPRKLDASDSENDDWLPNGLDVNNSEQNDSEQNDSEQLVAIDSEDGESQADDSETSEALSLSGGSESSTATKPPKRVRQSQRSGLGSLIQVVLGGAAAIPVTLLLLWYVVGIDVADAGPMVSKVAPWIVPQKFRGPQMAAGNRVTPPSSMNEMMSIRDDSDSAATEPPPATTTPEPPASDANNSQPNNSQPTETTQPASATADPTAVANDANAAEPKPDATPAAPAVEPVKPQPVADATQPANEPKTESQPAVSQPADASPANGELIAKIALAKKQIQDWKTNTENGSEDSKKKHIIELLDSLSAASIMAADLPEGSTLHRVVRNDFAEVGRSLVADQDLESWFRKAVYAQFNMRRSNAGRVVLMNLSDRFDAMPEAWRVTPADPLLNTPKLQLPMLEIPKQALGEVRPGQRIFMIGKLIESEPLSAPKQPLFRASFVYEL